MPNRAHPLAWCATSGIRVVDWLVEARNMSEAGKSLMVFQGSVLRIRRAGQGHGECVGEDGQGGAL